MNPASYESMEPDFSEYTILIVDDTVYNLDVLSSYLKLYGFKVLVARSGDSALKKVHYARPDLILLDVMMPGMDGFETCARLKNDEISRDIPVIFMTALAETENKVHGFEVGAVDYVTKPFQQEEVLARITAHLRLQDLTRRLKKKNRQLELSSQIGRQITSFLNLNEILKNVVDLIHTEYGYTYVGLWLVDPPNRQMVLKAGAGYDENMIPPYLSSVSLDNPQSILTGVYRSKQAGLFNDINLVEITGLPDVKAMLALPLRLGKKVGGVLAVGSNQPHIFDESDAVVLQMLADQLSIAIRNATLYDQITQLNNELEQKVQERTEELKIAYHNLKLIDQTKTDFIHVTSHELRTPILLIDGYTQLLQSEPIIEANPDLQFLLNNLSKGTQRMLDIVNTSIDATIFELEKLEVYLEPVLFETMFNLLADHFNAPLTERNLTLHRQNLAALPPIQGDQKMIYKLFYHLLINAIKFTPNGGKITVSGRLQTLNDATPAVEVVVADNGIGIDPAHLNLIFEKFYQTGKADFHSSGKTSFKGGGPGLGLAIAKGIVNAHGGKIWAQSSGHNEETFPGSQFYVVLPIDGPAQPAKSLTD